MQGIQALAITTQVDIYDHSVKDSKFTDEIPILS